MLRLLHFADAHIDMVTQGRHDPQSGLAVRAMDFLRALDTIVDAAIEEHVDLVIFAGDAYKDRTPVPTFQREWGRRVMRLSQAGIPTILLVGNHDLSPASGRAHALQEFETLAVPHVRVISQPTLLKPPDLDGLPVQILALPWVSRSALMASLNLSGAEPSEVFNALEERLSGLVRLWLDEQIDPALPVVLTAHASVQGAVYGGERTVMLGGDLVLPGSLVRDPRLDYVALGHIHKPQDLNEGAQPPVIYPGSIERVDIGETADDKFFVVAHLEKGQPTRVEWRKLNGRKFYDRRVRLDTTEGLNERILAALPPQEEIEDAVVRLVIEYPFNLDSAIDEPSVRRYAEGCLEFHLVRRPQRDTRLRLPEDHAVSSLTPLELLELYWRTVETDPDDMAELQKLAAEVLSGPQAAGGEEG
jgi:DNA repair protein SbcD/Mre11